MPSQILHALFGEDVIAGIHRRMAGRSRAAAGKALEKIRTVYRPVFALGCQGPDIFYHSRSRRPVGLEYGSLLHRRGAGTFAAGLLKTGLPELPADGDGPRRPCGEKGVGALGAYALGFMTHAILDRGAHPYIVYKSGFVEAGKPSSAKYARYHVFFERALDVLMLKELRGMEAAGWDQEGLLAETCAEPPPGLRGLLARALTAAFPERAGRDTKLALRIGNTFADCARFYRMTAPAFTSVANRERHPETGDGMLPYLYYLYPENLRESTERTGTGFLNLARQPWYAPVEGGREDRRSFPEIYRGAVEAAVESIAPVIAGYLDTGVFPVDAAARALGNGGLSIVDADGRPRRPTRADPLPLDSVLEEQARLRGA